MVSSGDGTWGSWKMERQGAPLCNLGHLWNFASCASTACSSWDYKRALIPNACDHTSITPPWWTWVWVDSGSWWWTGSSGILQSMGLQRVGHDWATELKWTPWSRLSCPCPVPFNWLSLSPGWDLHAKQSPSLLLCFPTHPTACPTSCLNAYVKNEKSFHIAFISPLLSRLNPGNFWYNQSCYRDKLTVMSLPSPSDLPLKMNSAIFVP